MFERFTEQARHVVVLAQEEARSLRHDYIGSEHLLLGLLRVGGSATAALQSVGVGLDQARERVVEIVGGGKEARFGQIPFTPRAKHVLERALREALSAGDDHIGDEHLLLGLLRQTDGVAVEVLSGFGVDTGELASRAREAAAQGIRTGQSSVSIDVLLPLSEPATEVLARATEIAREQGAKKVELSHLREALGREDETGV